MDGLLKLDTLILFVVFVVPGFVAIKAHDLMVPAARRNFSQSIIEVVSYSMINLAVLFWAVSLLHRDGFSQAHPALYFLGMFGVLFVGPVLLAVASRWVRRSRWFGRYLLHPAPTAWDYFFDKREHLWVLCHLKDDRMVGGIYSGDSNTSSYPYDKDIYIQEMWRTDKDGHFTEPVPQSRGLLVRAEDCWFVEFFRPGGTS